MSDEKKGADDAPVEAGGPGSAYQVFITMEELLDKFKLLHYEETFCKQLGFKAFSR